MNWYKIFYWMTVAENAKIFFIIFAVIFTTVGCISMLINLGAFDDVRNSSTPKGEPIQMAFRFEEGDNNIDATIH